MALNTFALDGNIAIIESAYQRWRADPSSVDESWRYFFEGFELAEAGKTQPAGRSPVQGAIIRLIDAYRELGHLQAHLDPLSPPPAPRPELELREFDLSDELADQTLDLSHFLGLAKGTLAELVQALRDTYCRTIGVEFMHIQDRPARQWLEERMERCRNRPSFAREMKLRILRNLRSAELFEKFLHSSYVGQKRFSLEGGETLIPLLDSLVEKAAADGIKEIILGMSHRGRLNVLANILGKPYGEIFSEFEDNYLPLSSGGDGDVKYHLGFSCDRESAGRSIHLSLSPNPSHLEAVDPLVEGRTRAKQQQFGDVERVQGLAVLIHGDASLAGQGVVAETLNLSQLAGFTTGGTVHVVVNNQIGFTTSPADARSTVYCTDVAKMIEAPIFHVNAEDAEAAVYLAELALDFRQTFHRDIFIDLVCYRRHGHNESDDPSFTQPIMAARIKEQPSLGENYMQRLQSAGELSADEAAALDDERQTSMQEAKERMGKERMKDEGGRMSERMKDEGGRTKAENESVSDSSFILHPSSFLPHPSSFSPSWDGFVSQYEHDAVATGITQEMMAEIVTAVTQIPEGFHAHPRIARAMAARLEDFRAGKPVDWALAETLAFGSLLLEGVSVRLSGQDSQRGTFSQRHAVLVDMQTAAEYCPLSTLAGDKADFAAIDSPLSEFAVLGFEFGYSLDSPQTLVLWEAQFGDFANGAEVIIDQFLTSGEAKWRRFSGLVLLLPHGYEGQGPEHSSARLERYLQLCAEDNIQVCNPSTPGQYFHLLRRQMHRRFRKPLIVMTPKSLLRHKKARSPLEAFTTGQFQEVIDDPTERPGEVRRVLLCSGKIYYDLLEKRPADDARIAVVRVEQLYPLEEELLTKVLGRYAKAREWVWVQEEPSNMGAWSFMEPRLRGLGFTVSYVGRDASASPAVGSHRIHVEEQEAIVAAALAGKAPKYVCGRTRAEPTADGHARPRRRTPLSPGTSSRGLS